MIYYLTILGLIVAELFGSVPSQEDKTVARRQVTVRISVQADGKPLADFPVLVKAKAASATGRTNVIGACELVLSVPADTPALMVIPAPIPPGAGVHGADRGRVIDEQQRQISEFCFDRFYGAALLPAVDAYQVEIAGAPAHAVRVRPVDADGAPVRAILISRDVLLGIRSYNLPDGVLELRGLPAGREVTVFILSDGGLVTPLDVPAGVMDVDAGSVAVRRFGEVGDVQVVVKWPLDYPWKPENGGRGMSLVALDGKFAISSTEKNMVKDTVIRSTAIAKVPAGKYYVVGGFFTASPAQTAVVDAARKGLGLSGLGVPMLTVVAGKQTEIEVDARAIERSLKIREEFYVPQVVPGGKK